ncbi:LysR substrate-binding domain-containing protein [Aminobacter aminovorans]|uniref:DNA-binding transcriptional LysR family regulator n=1 Tax=Aminobacter aminovorans TaxID=83263 RepID=A0AAC8YVA5_AMIAI|nr:LysR substrate-binding domain-containing protein [Aminobacter aminovorans]AMS45097.1 transcriptional regulator [Aminobacter aminovorans]MBB3705148.1 DNA-binding transcriptional LysR family regulator [Aminobacter aminovorans]
MKRSEIPSLDDLRAFHAAARLGSVRLAADELALTHGAVSRRITKLSQDIGLRLFERSGRGLRLTGAGEALNLTLGRFFAELSTTIENLRATDSRRSALVLSCEPSVAMRWLIPRLASFQADHPEIALHLSVGGGAVEFRRERIDLAIRRLDFPLPEAWHVQRLFAEKMGPVMTARLAPAFADGDYIVLGAKTRPDAWSHWLSAHPSVPRPSEVRFHDHHFLAVEAASAGLGVALSPLVLAIDDIEKGRLVAPAGFDADGSHYGLIWTGSLELGQNARMLAEWLQAECTRSFG